MRRRAVLFAAAALLVAACGADPADTGAGTNAATTVASGGAASGAPALLDLSAPLVGGGQLDLRTFAGRPVAFWFWAPG